MERVYRYDRPTRLMGQAGRVVLVVGVTGTATGVLAGCGSSGSDLLTSVALPAEISNSAHEQTIRPCRATPPSSRVISSSRPHSRSISMPCASRGAAVQ